MRSLLEQHPIVSKMVGGHKLALEFLRMMAQVLHAWDDLVDKDKGVLGDCDINDAFTLALVRLPRNSFYREHFDDLNPILTVAIINWRIATAVERRGAAPDDGWNSADLQWAYVIRSTYVDLVTMSAAILHGPDHAATMGIELRQWAHSEGFVKYLENLAAEQVARSK